MIPSRNTLATKTTTIIITITNKAISTAMVGGGRLVKAQHFKSSSNLLQATMKAGLED